MGEAEETARTLGIEFLAGTELSAALGRIEVHVLGLGVATDSTVLNASIEGLIAGRSDRADAIVDRLNALGVPAQREAIEKSAGASIGRMHIAQEIVRLGFATTVQGAFDKYIKAGRPAYVPKKGLDCSEAIRIIHEAGGLAFIAHPGVGKLHKHLAKLLAFPFDGIEVYHSRHSPGHVSQFTEAARENGLLVSGGSDCHGRVKGEDPLMGSVHVPYDVYARIKDALPTR